MSTRTCRYQNRSLTDSLSDLSSFQEGFEFKKPTQPASRPRVRSFNGGPSREAFSCRPSSAPALMVRAGGPAGGAGSGADPISVPQLSSPPPVTQQLRFCDSSPSSLNDDEDDGFLEILDDHDEVGPGPARPGPVRWRRLRVTPSVPPQGAAGMPTGMASLLTAPLVADGAADPVSRTLVQNLPREATASE